ncbi:hypothetical protein N9M16_01430 [Candidatus Dependentiae bacterium]|nr:hypothetical protein [Candidatus Dependentiae bacterium]
MTSCFRYIQARREAERIARIRASGEVIGGDVVVLGGGTNGGAEGGGAEEGGADTAVRTGGKTRAWDGCVARIDVSNLSKGRHTDEDDDTAVRRRGRFGGLGSTRPEQKKFVLDEGNRWKTEARIAAGGTGGTAELERLRRAAQRLEENNKESGGSNSKRRLGSIDAEDEDAPVVVAPEELTFGDDGWATTAETAETASAILNGTQPAIESSSLQKDLLDAELRLKTAAEAALLDGEDAAREIAARAVREAARRERLARTLGNLPGDEELPTDGSNGESKSKSNGSKKRRKKALVSFDEED